MRCTKLSPSGLVAIIICVATGTAAIDSNASESPAVIVTIDSKILGEERTLVVALPPTYEQGRSDYPVLYYLDADTLSANPLPADLGTLPEMIAVGIANTDRDRDMFPVYVGPTRPTSGGAENFLRFLETEVIPLVDQKYRTTNQRILFGMSNSALFTVYALLKRPETFAGYLASSPMIGWCFEFMRDQAEAFVASHEPVDAFLYMIYGDDDSSRVIAAVPPLLEVIESDPRPGLRWEVAVIEGGSHVPPESLSRGLGAFFSPRPR
jgi:predicted alpha/beta superfamily hydrolase